MEYPARINAKWIDSLDDDELIEAEGALHRTYLEQESAEKQRRGDEYDLYRGPESLINAWQHWMLVSNAIRARGLRVAR